MSERMISVPESAVKAAIELIEYAEDVPQQHARAAALGVFLETLVAPATNTMNDMDVAGMRVLLTSSAVGLTAANIERANRLCDQAIEANELRAQLSTVVPPHPADDEPTWIVNDIGELGVKIRDRFFFLYKGGNIEYDGEHDEGDRMKWRIVGKREFGETCWPLKWVVAGKREDRYTEELVYTSGLSDGKTEDGQWKNLPLKKKGAE